MKEVEKEVDRGGGGLCGVGLTLTRDLMFKGREEGGGRVSPSSLTPHPLTSNISYSPPNPPPHIPYTFPLHTPPRPLLFTPLYSTHIPCKISSLTPHLHQTGTLVFLVSYTHSSPLIYINIYPFMSSLHSSTSCFSPLCFNRIYIECPILP